MQRSTVFSRRSSYRIRILFYLGDKLIYRANILNKISTGDSLDITQNRVLNFFKSLQLSRTNTTGSVGNFVKCLIILQRWSGTFLMIIQANLH